MAQPVAIRNRIYQRFALFKRRLFTFRRSYELHLQARQNISPLERILLNQVRFLPDYSQKQISQLNLRQLLGLRKEIGELKVSLEKYSKITWQKKEHQLTRKIAETLKDLDRTIRSIERSIKHKSPIKPASLPIPQAKHQKGVSDQVARFQVLNQNQGELSCTVPVQPVRVKKSISAKGLRRAVNRYRCLQPFERPIARDIKVISPSPALNIVGRILIEILGRKFVVKVADKTSGNGKFTQREISDAVKDLNRYLAQFNDRAKSQGYETANKRAKAAEKAGETRSEEISFKTVANKNGEVTGVEISGKQDPGQLIEVANKLIAEQTSENVNIGKALPALIEESAKISDPVLNSQIETVIQTIAQTSAGQKMVLAAFAGGRKTTFTTLLTATEAGKKVVIQTARNILKNVNEKGKSVVAAKSHTARLIALANPLKLNIVTLTEQNARDFVELVAKADHSIKLVDKTKPKQVAQKQAKASKRPAAKRNVKTNLPPKQTAAVSKAFHQLSVAAKTSNLILPDKLIKHLQAGLAGVNLPSVAPANTPVGQYTAPQKSSHVRNTEHWVAAMEAAVSKPEVKAAQDIAPINPYIETETKKPLTRQYVINEIWRMLDNPVFAEVVKEVNEIIRRLKQERTSIDQVAEDVNNNHLKAKVPVYNMVLALSIEKLKERTRKTTVSEPAPVEAETHKNDKGMQVLSKLLR